MVATVAVCREHGAPLLSRGGGTSLTGGCCNVAVVMDWSKYLNKVLCDRPGAEARPGAAGHACSTSSAREAEKHSLTFAPDPSTHTHYTLGGMIGNNSCGVHSLMGLGTGRTSDQVHELDILLYDGTRMTVGATSDDELERIIRDGGRQGEIYAQLKALRDRYADEIRRRYPKNSRAASPATTSTTCCPRTGSTSPGRCRAPRGRASPSSRRACTWSTARPSSRCSCSAIPTSIRRATTSPRSWKSKPIGLEGIDDVLVDDMKKKGIHPQDITLLPDGRRLAAGRVRRREQGRVRRQGPAS